MSATTEYTTFSDLYNGVQRATRDATGVTATENLAKVAINVALQDMHLGFDYKFPWAERRATLVTQEDYSTGTLAITRGDTVLTGTGTAWNANNDFGVKAMRVGGKITINGGVEVYEIASVTNDTTAALTSDFVRATVTAAEYSYFEDEYALHADFLRPVSQTSFDSNLEIPLIGRREFERRYPRNKTVGKPIVASMYDLAFGSNTTPVRKVRFHNPPDGFYSVPYSFITAKLAVSASGTEGTNLSADTDEPIVPLRYRHAIMYHALYHWYSRKDDDRAAMYKGEYSELMMRISGDTEVGASRPQLRPRVGGYVSRARRPWGGSGRYSSGTAFDELRS